MSDPARAGVDERRPRGWRSFAFDVALALLATGVELASVIDASGTASVPAIVLAAVAGGALVLRRSAPLPVLATTLAAGVVVAALGDEPAGVAGAIALYTTAAMCERRVSLAALVPTVAVIVFISLNLPEYDGPGPESAIPNTLAAVGVWGLGAYMQTRRRYLRELEARADQLEREREQLAQIAVMEERASIARELHDIVAHSVTVMLVGVRGAREHLRTAPDVAEDTLARVETSGERSVAELRRILTLLRGSHRDAESRPQPSLGDLEALVEEHRASGLPIELAISGRAQPLPDGVELSIYRIVQEALTNAVKHTRANQVTVRLAYEDAGIKVDVTDDGAPVTAGPASSGHGLVGMRERAALFGGTLTAGPRGDHGFEVHALLPYGERSPT
jgi:signal transduction histidine kinase